MARHEHQPSMPAPSIVLSQFVLAVIAWMGVSILFVGKARAEPIEPATTLSQAAEFAFHDDNILGTSLDLIVVAPDERTAQDCERVVLDEIERLRLRRS